MMSVFLSHIAWFVSDIEFFLTILQCQDSAALVLSKILQCLHAYWSIYALNSCFPNINFTMVILKFYTGV